MTQELVGDHNILKTKPASLAAPTRQLIPSWKPCRDCARLRLEGRSRTGKAGNAAFSLKAARAGRHAYGKAREAGWWSALRGAAPNSCKSLPATLIGSVMRNSPTAIKR